MPKTRAIVPLTHPKSGDAVAAGAELDLDDEAYAALRAQGAVEASAQEAKANATPEAEGNYSAKTGRADAGEQESPPPRKKS